MAGIDKVFQAIRTDFAKGKLLLSAARAMTVFIVLYVVLRIPTLFGLSFDILGFSYDLFISVTVGVVVFITLFFVGLSRFSYIRVEKKVPQLGDVLTTARQYRRKNNPFRDQLFDELKHSAQKSSTSPLIPYGSVINQVCILIVGIALLFSLSYIQLVELDDLQSLIPDVIEQTGERFGVKAPQAPDINVNDDDSIYGDAVSVDTLEGDVQQLRVMSGNSGGNFDEEEEVTFDRTFDAVYSADTIEAVVDPTQTQKLPRDIALARDYSLQVRDIQQ